MAKSYCSSCNQFVYQECENPHSCDRYMTEKARKNKAPKKEWCKYCREYTDNPCKSVRVAIKECQEYTRTAEEDWDE